MPSPKDKGVSPRQPLVDEAVYRGSPSKAAPRRRKASPANNNQGKAAYYQNQIANATVSKEVFRIAGWHRLEGVYSTVPLQAGQGALAVSGIEKATLLRQKILVEAASAIDIPPRSLRARDRGTGLPASRGGGGPPSPPRSRQYSPGRRRDYDTSPTASVAPPSQAPHGALQGGPLG